MREPDNVSELIEDIYDAALEPARWSDVVVNINDLVGSQACGIISKDSSRKSGSTHYHCGIDPHYIELYSDTYSKFDPLMTLASPGRIVTIPDVVAYDEYRRGPFYQDWLRPQGCADMANVVLEKPNSNYAVILTFLPGQGRMLDDEMRRRIALIAPHARRALGLNKAIGLTHSAAATFADTLNGLSAGIFLVDANCQIVHANAAGHDILRGDDFLRSINGQLIARNAHVNQTLRDVCVVNGAAAIARGTSLPLTAHDGERYVMHLLPLTAAARRATGTAYKAVAALFVQKVELNSQSSGKLIARTFELTPAELRVLLAIVEVGGGPKAAASLGVADSTIKTHLEHLFKKTGVSRQADLVKIVAGFSTPLAD